MTNASDYSTTAKPREKKAPMEPRPSSSIVLLSPSNQVLLLHRVKTSSSFASAYVFPGGNLAENHDGPVPPPGDATRHEDSLAYRLGAIRETFEESGILLARSKSGGTDGGLLNLPAAERDAARKAIYNNEVRFTEWLDSVGGVADTAGLHPFTRWITPPATPKRFTTQMYLYMLPLSTAAAADPAVRAAEREALVPTPDGAEVLSSAFDDAAHWLARQRRGDVILFPPQAFLLTLVARFCAGPPPAGGEASVAREHYEAQRRGLLDFLGRVPTAAPGSPHSRSPTANIPWADKVISPATAAMLDDGRAVLSLDKPGPELKGTGRGGDFDRVVLVRFAKGTALEVEVRPRADVFDEMRNKEQAKDAKL